MTKKRCCRCKVIKKKTEFYKDSSKPDKLTPQCKSCIRIYYYKNQERYSRYNQAYRKTHRYKWRHAQDCKRYGLSTEESDIVEQLRINGKCFCCGTRSNGMKLYLDHDHDTGRTRGILCHKCNSFEGYLTRQVELGIVKLSGFWKDYLLNPPGIDFNELKKYI